MEAENPLLSYNCLEVLVQEKWVERFQVQEMWVERFQAPDLGRVYARKKLITLTKARALSESSLSALPGYTGLAALRSMSTAKVCRVVECGAMSNMLWTRCERVSFVVVQRWTQFYN